MMIQSVWKNYWSAESQDLIPAKPSGVALNADLEPKCITKHQWLVHRLQSFHTLQNCCNRGGNNFFKYMDLFVATVRKCPFSLLKKEVSQYFCPYECTSHGVWWWVFGSRSAFKVTPECSAGIMTWLSAHQSSSSTLTESTFIFDLCLIHRGTVMLK